MGESIRKLTSRHRCERVIRSGVDSMATNKPIMASVEDRQRRHHIERLRRRFAHLEPLIVERMIVTTELSGGTGDEDTGE